MLSIIVWFYNLGHNIQIRLQLMKGMLATVLNIKSN